MYACEICGRVASTHILEGYVAGRPLVRRLCLECVEMAPDSPASEQRPGLRPALPALAMLSGLTLLAIGLLGDILVPDRHAGFGWYQQTGVVVASMTIVVGLLLRVDVLALGGLFLFVASLGADWFGLVSGPGIGWKQQTLAGAGAALAISATCVWGLRRRGIVPRRRGMTRAAFRRSQALPSRA